MNQRVPWSRVVIEGVVIVGSILLAFGIEASWAGRQESAVATAFEELLRTDLAEDIAEMQQRNARADSIVSGLEELARIIDGLVSVPASDSLAILLNYSFSASSFTPSLASYDVLGGGSVSELVPPGVQVQLAEYLDGLAALDLALQVEAAARLVELAGEYGGLPALLSRADHAMAVPSAFVGTESGDQKGFVEDPLFGSWLWVHLIVVEAEREWRRQWIGRLNDVIEGLETS